MKPGFKTTEFWLTLPIQIVNILVQIGVIPSGDASMLQTSTGKLVVGLVAGINIWHYIKSRTLVKSAALTGTMMLLFLFMPQLAKAG